MEKKILYQNTKHKQLQTSVVTITIETQGQRRSLHRKR